MDGAAINPASSVLRRGGRIVNAMSVDVEDYFQVEALSQAISRDAWENLPRRVERNCERLLALFAESKIHVTFFVLGWIAERHPAMVRRMAEAGHEIASHGLKHERADRQTPEQFRADIRRSKTLLEDIGGVPVKGYRAATFSIGATNLWTFDVLAEEGFAYSSSLYPIAHDLYGMPDAPRAPFRAGTKGLIEIPLSTLHLFGRNFPCAGGGYFRLLPYAVSRWSFGRLNAREQRPGVFYLHPWEIDPEQPRQAGLTVKSRFRHYLNLARMEDRLRRLTRDFAWGRVDEVFLGKAGNLE
jgi:polysaccharide deacetylase family protein (PEP-CTERM system associated)